MEIILIGLGAINVILLIIVVILVVKKSGNANDDSGKYATEIAETTKKLNEP